LCKGFCWEWFGLGLALRVGKLERWIVWASVWLEVAAVLL